MYVHRTTQPSPHSALYSCLHNTCASFSHHLGYCVALLLCSASCILWRARLVVSSVHIHLGRLRYTALQPAPHCCIYCCSPRMCYVATICKTIHPTNGRMTTITVVAVITVVSRECRLLTCCKSSERRSSRSGKRWSGCERKLSQRVSLKPRGRSLLLR